MRTDAAIERFLASAGLAEATRRAYASDLRGFARWLRERDLALADVDARVLADWIGDQGRGRSRPAPTTIARRLAAVRSCLRFTFGAARVPDAALAPR
ncbi:MAG TPA: site-specific integrase, partial [Gaiellaceae bacterium]|nr:site-specific integrase [Gaiellaceae bacterium]